MSVLSTFAPLFLAIILAAVWLIMAFAVGVAWAVNRFQLGKIASGVVLLLLLIVLPTGAWLLGRSFFGSELFSAGENEKPSTKLDKISFVLESIESLKDGSGQPSEGPAASGTMDGSGQTPQEAASSGTAVGARIDIRMPEDYSDEELLALAQENFEDMYRMDVGFINGGPLPIALDEHIIIDYEDPYGETGTERRQWYFNRVPGYATLEEAKAAAAKVWYKKFARKYYLDPGAKYVYFNGAVYTPDGALGGTDAPFVVDGIVGRTADEVVFTGRWLRDDGRTFGTADFSFVYENGRWKYGHFI